VRVFVRYAHDIQISRTGKPIIRSGPGGRSSLTGHTATVFGANGFVGRYLVSKLAKQGTTVVVPWRSEDAKRPLKVSGDLGQVVMLEFDLRNTQSIEEAVRHSNIVYNLIGRDYETKNFTYEDVHIEGTERIVEAVAKYDVDRFVQVSCMNANPESTSKFYRTKALGEEAARKVFPETTIVRPAAIFGAEDRFLNNLASRKSIFTSYSNDKYIRPVHVEDVARGLELLMFDDSTAGQLFELYGPREYTATQMLDLVSKVTMRSSWRFDLPKPVLKAIARVLDKLYWHVVCPDEIERQFIDISYTDGAKTFQDLGIEPIAFEMLALKYLRMYRSSTLYDVAPTREESHGRYIVD